MKPPTRKLNKARKTRTQIAQTFSALDNDQLSVTELIRNPPACLTRIRAYDVIRRIPHMHNAGAEHVLQHARVWPLRTMGDMTDEEKARIILALPPRVKH